MAVTALTPDVGAHRYAVVNGVRLHYVEAGSGPLVVLLHGFPEFWYSWRHQIPALAAAGFRVLAPDLRGYNESEKPAGTESYRLQVLSADVAGLIEHVGARQANVVGHDWGGAIAWHLAMRRPELLQKLVILNAPHPARFRQELRNPAQLLRSWYLFFFQLPRLPEWLLRSRDYAFLDRALRQGPGRPDAFTEEDVRRYKEAIARPGALTAAVHYYRAAVRRLCQTSGPCPPIHVPTLLIWGERDRYLGRRLTEGLERWVPQIRIERLSEASHWVQNDAPEQVNRLLLDFLGTGVGEG